MGSQCVPKVMVGGIPESIRALIVCAEMTAALTLEGTMDDDFGIDVGAEFLERDWPDLDR